MLIDEVHLLNENRGAVLEAGVVSRIKLVAAAQSMQQVRAVLFLLQGPCAEAERLCRAAVSSTCLGSCRLQERCQLSTPLVSLLPSGMKWPRQLPSAVLGTGRHQAQLIMLMATYVPAHAVSAQQRALRGCLCHHSQHQGRGSLAASSA